MTHRKFEYFITLNEQHKEFCLLRHSRHKISAFFKRISSFSSSFLYFFSFFDPKVRWKRNWEKSRKSTRHGSVACIEIQCFLFFSLFFLVRLCRSLNSTFTNTLTCRVLRMNCMYCHERNFFMLNGFFKEEIRQVLCYFSLFCWNSYNLWTLLWILYFYSTNCIYIAGIF